MLKLVSLKTLLTALLKTSRRQQAAVVLLAEHGLKGPQLPKNGGSKHFQRVELAFKNADSPTEEEIVSFNLTRFFIVIHKSADNQPQYYYQSVLFGPVQIGYIPSSNTNNLENTTFS